LFSFQAPRRDPSNPSVRLLAMRLVLAALCLLAALPLFAGTIVVLPFFNLTGNDALDWIGESAAETVREALAVEGLPVLDRLNREEAYRRLALRRNARLTRASIIKIGELADAEYVIFGSFRLPEAPEPGAPDPKAPLRFEARILNLKQLTQTPEDFATAAVEDLSRTQLRLAWMLLSRLEEAGRAPSEAEFLEKHPTVRLDALEQYTRGLLAGSPEQKHRFFTQAARLDAGFSAPCFELGRLLLADKNYKAAASWFERVGPASSHHLEALFFLGICRFHTVEYDKAVAALSRVAALAPLGEVWNNLGAAQSRLNSPEAAVSFQKAVQADPYDPVYLFNLGYALLKSGQFEEAAEKFRAVLNSNSEDEQATLLLGRCLNRKPVQSTELALTRLERIKETADFTARQQQLFSKK